MYIIPGFLLVTIANYNVLDRFQRFLLTCWALVVVLRRWVQFPISNLVSREFLLK